MNDVKLDDQNNTGPAITVTDESDQAVEIIEQMNASGGKDGTKFKKKDKKKKKRKQF